MMYGKGNERAGFDGRDGFDAWSVQTFEGEA